MHPDATRPRTYPLMPTPSLSFIACLHHLFSRCSSATQVTRTSRRQKRFEGIVHGFVDAATAVVEERRPLADLDPPEYIRVLRFVEGARDLCSSLTTHHFTPTSSALPLLKPMNLPFVPREPKDTRWTQTSIRIASWLPSLSQSPAREHRVPPCVNKYAEQKQLRAKGLSWARYQHAPAGTLTAPHIDTDIHHIPVHTILQQQVGECVILAWDTNECSETNFDAFRPETWYSQLNALQTLECQCMSGACSIAIRANAVHMVLTCQDKEHFSYHIYPN